MQNISVIFEKVYADWNWKPIRNCPGRFILAEGATKLTANDIMGVDFPVYKFRPPIIPNEVLVIKFSDLGGLISYIKSGNKFLHTLNNKDGFERKLRQLEIILPQTDF